MSRRPFFLGVGAQRSGTTWIGHYLRSLPDVNFSPLKEVNFFDSKYVEGRKGAILVPVNTRLAILGLGNFTRRRPISGLRLCYHYAGMRRLKDSSYRAYFDVLRQNGKVAGEICPSYAMLEADSISKMEQLLDQPNYFFIMRNPVDRLVSQYSFLQSNKRLETPKGNSLDDALHALCAQSQYTDYARSLSAYREVIPRERFLTLFTENLFDPSQTQVQCDRLCDFLGVRTKKAPVKNEVNRAPSVVLSDEIRRGLVGKLSAVYTEVGRLYGTELPASWRSDLKLLETGA
ncbi:MAG: sulfotransferase domain-containing protein [Pseudomonadota bacterium]